MSIVNRIGEGEVDTFYFGGDDGGAWSEPDIEQLEGQSTIVSRVLLN